MGEEVGNQLAEVHRVMASTTRTYGRESWRRDRLALAAIALVAVFLRLYGIDFGLPLHYHIDETRVMDRVIRMVSSGDPNPHFFHYPSFIFYFLCAVTLAYYGIHYIVFAIASLAGGGFPSLAAFRADFAANESSLYLLGRFSMALFGVATVLLVYFLVKELFTRRAALLASLFVAAAPLHVLESHYIKQEVPMTFFMFIALFLGVLGTKTGGRWTSAAVGFASGVAASVKYNGLLALSVAPLLFREGGKLSLRSFFGKGTVGTFFIALLAFLAISPFVLFDFPQFRTDLAYEMFHVAEKGQHGFDLNGEGIVYHRFLYQLLAAFPFSLGIPLYVAGIAGTIAALMRREGALLWLLFFSVPYFLLTSVMKVVFLRYYMPLIVVFCIMAGYGFDVLLSRAPRLRGIVSLVVVVLVGWTVAFTFSLERHMPRGKSSFDQALVFVRESVSPGSKVSFTHFTPPLSGETYRLVHMRPENFAESWLAAESPDAIVASGLVTVGFFRGGDNLVQGRKFLDDLRGGKLGYIPAARFENGFLSKRFFGRIDPTLAQTFMPEIEIFLKESRQR
jgi:4-amino-4-deoxy-L-arabinose transferase-like glycosyltransferase